MTNLIGLIVLLAVSFLLGKMIFDRNNPSVQKATEPAMRNVVWQFSLVASSLFFFSRYGHFSDLGRYLVTSDFVWILVSFGILIFSVIAMVRTLKNRSAAAN